MHLFILHELSKQRELHEVKWWKILLGFILQGGPGGSKCVSVCSSVSATK